MRRWNSAPTVVLALLLTAACSTPEPAFRQHAYQELAFPRTLAFDVRDADWIDREIELHGEPNWSVGERLTQEMGEPVFDLHRINRRLRYLHSPQGRADLLRLSGYPHASDERRQAASRLDLVVLSSETGLSLDTDMEDIAEGSVSIPAGILGGAIVGAGTALGDLDDFDCSGDGSVAFIICSSVFITAVASGALVGAVVGGTEAELSRREQTEQAQREAERAAFVASVHASLADFRPLGEFVEEVERELLSAGYDVASVTEYSRGADLSAGLTGEDSRLSSSTAAQPAGQRVTRAGNAFATVAHSDPARVEEGLAGVRAAREGVVPTLAVSLHTFGLYPLIEEERVVYSYVAVATATFAVPLTAGQSARPDELVRTIATDSGERQRLAVLARRFPIVLPARSLAEWSADGASLFERDMQLANERLAQRVVDYSLRLHRADMEMTLERSAAAASPYRLRGLEPGEDQRDFFDEFAWALNPFAPDNQIAVEEMRHANGCRPIAVGALRPTLRWTPVPKTASEQTLAAFESLSYEVRVFDDGLREIYRADGLAQSGHQIETELLPGAHYYWTVRARFELDGRERVTDWAVCGNPNHPFPHIDDEPITEFYPFQTGG